MKKVLSILLAIMVIGACATTDANAKKKSTKSRKTTTTTIRKGALEGFWADADGLYHGLQINLEYDSSDDTYFGTLYGQEEMCSGYGEVKGNTLYLDCSDGYTVTCTLNGNRLKVRVKSPYGNYSSNMKRISNSI